MKLFRTLTLLLATLVAVSGAVAADSPGQEITADEVATEMNVLVERGMSLERASIFLSNKYKNVISNDPNAIAYIYNAISVAAKRSNIDPSSADFGKAVAATSDIAVNEHGISESVIINATLIAGIDMTTVISTLPASAGTVTGTHRVAQEASTISKAAAATGTITTSPGGSGGGPASPAS